MTSPHSRLLGLGSAFPERILSNDDLAARVGTSDAWIQERTGIAQRRQLADGQNNSDIAVAAALSALTNAGLAASEIDLVLACTNTPDRWLPSLGSAVQARLGLRPGVPAYDIVTACAGWLAGLQTADALVRSGHHRHVLVIGSESRDGKVYHMEFERGKTIKKLDVIGKSKGTGTLIRPPANDMARSVAG